jgi:hypothetical protein
LKGEEKKGLRTANEDWENELWSFVHAGSGKNCPGLDSCQSLRDGPICFNSAVQRAKNRAIHLLVDNDDLNLTFASTVPRLEVCPYRSRITGLVKRLTQKYLSEWWDGVLPVSDILITRCPNGLPIEVRNVPLKANHGAVWHTNSGWVIHLNSASSPARRRFTLYHEIFHILVHSNGDTSIKKSYDDELCFNEYLADFFAGEILTPQAAVLAKWEETKDINMMAQVFVIPTPIMYGKLRANGLIAMISSDT